METTLLPKSIFRIVLLCASTVLPLRIAAEAASETVRVWEPIEITLTSNTDHPNPYREVEVWVQLKGPGFQRKVPAFWDGGRTWKARLVAPREGAWTWVSQSNQADEGLNAQEARFQATGWSEAELAENPNRRGFIRPTDDGHSLRYADGTPFFLMADTIWAASTRVMPFDSDEGQSRLSFQNAIRIRKEQGYNSIALIAAFPNWAEDGLGDKVVADGTVIRSHGVDWRTNDGMDEEGNRPFEMRDEPQVSGQRVMADFWRLNPSYFRQLDRKMAHLAEQGFVPFLETFRRDHGQSLKRWTPEWKAAFARFFEYLIARYGSYNVIWSALHYDWDVDTLSIEEWRSAVNWHYRHYGSPALGQTVTALTVSASHLDWGHDALWLELHGVGNQGPRNNRYAQWLYDQYFLPNPKPTLNQEPVYPGRPVGGAYGIGDRQNSLSNAWTSVLCGGFAGHIYGSNFFSGVTADVAMGFASAPVIPHLGTFMLSEGDAYQRLVPQVRPGPGFYGEMVYSITEDKSLAMAFYQREAGTLRIAGLSPRTRYHATWFHPETGGFIPLGAVRTDRDGRWAPSSFPNGEQTAAQHWALKLVK
jgi:hypothetical protein